MNKIMKRFVIYIAIGILGISSLTVLGSSMSFVKKYKPVKISTKEIKKKTEAIDVDLKIPVISGMKNKQIADRINNTFLMDALNFKNPLVKEANKYLADTKKDKNLHFNKYSAYTTFKTHYNKNGILSIAVRYSQYTGGANGLEVQRGYTTKLENGKMLKLSEIFDKDFNYKKIISDEILKQMKAHSENYFVESIKNFKQINDDQPFYIEDGNLVVFYGPFDIAPHVYGIPEFKIPFLMLKFNNNFNVGE